MRKKYRDEKIRIGECLDCERPVELKKRRCKKHLEFQRLAKEKARAVKPGGQCSNCQETVVTGRTRCEKCATIGAKAQVTLRAKRIKQGVCPRCGREKTEEDAENNQCCVICTAANYDNRRDN